MEKQQAFVLRIAPGEVDHVEEALEKDHLIIGWACAEGLIGKTLERDAFREIVRREYYAKDDNLRKVGNATGHLWRFIREMEKDDLVVVPYGSDFYVGRVTEHAFYDASKVDDDSAYRRPVEWLNGKKPIPRKYAKSALVSRMRIRGDMCGCLGSRGTNQGMRGHSEDR